MKILPAPIVSLLMGLAINPAASAQSLPASMAYPSPLLFRHTPSSPGHELLIADNGLALDHRSAFDMSKIPAAPDAVVRSRKTSSPEALSTPAAPAPPQAGVSKLARSGMLLAVLAIAYLVTRKRPDQRMRPDISELRNFPKKRLARREAHA
jgi:hypothetical protein